MRSTFMLGLPLGSQKGQVRARVHRRLPPCDELIQNHGLYTWTLAATACGVESWGPGLS